MSESTHAGRRHLNLAIAAFISHQKQTMLRRAFALPSGVNVDIVGQCDLPRDSLQRWEDDRGAAV